MFRFVVAEMRSIVRNLQLPLQLEDPFDEIGLRPTDLEREHAERLRKILTDWHAPEPSLRAALVSPFLERNPKMFSKLGTTFDQEAVALAKELVDWRRSLASTSGPSRAMSGERLSVALGRLYRLAYLEVPSFPLTLLLLADHEASMMQSDFLTPETALHTSRVLAPLAEMLGIWSLYRTWTERTYSVLFPEQYTEMKGLLGRAEDYSEIALRKIAKHQQDLAANKSKRDKGEPSSPYIQDKAEAYSRLKETLKTSLRKMKVKARIRPISRYTGLALKRVHDGESNEEVARRLSVRVICRSVADCYTTLGVIHSLGKPVSIGSTLHFKDHIASPQANGYRALHATITFRNFRAKGGGAIAVECRILTDSMHQINERGVIVTRNTSRRLSPLNAWWNRIPELDRQLAKTKDGSGLSGMQEYLSRNQLQSISDPLYIFTPRGEIVLLPSESTPLDFAYSIHTQMGHHAVRTDVNGKTVPHGYPLRNGDIVRVHYDPNLAGPDISWLGLVKTTWARASIQRGLKWRGSVVHKGRAYYEEALLRTLNWYERQKHYKLNLSTERIEDFLLERARLSGYSEVRELYSEMNGNKKLTQLLIQKLISAEFALGIVNSRERPIITTYESNNIKLCMNCRAVPEEPIIGIENVSQNGKRHLMVHVDGKNQCGQSAEGSKRVVLKWVKPVAAEPSDLLVFRVKGVDRPVLLREVLNVIYQTPKTDLLKVDARTDAQGLADIVLLVRGEWFGGLDRVPERLGKIAGVHEVKDSPPSPAQRKALSAVPINFSQFLTPNPYTSEEVFNRGIFYDRQELLDQLLLWLREPAPYHSMILHGQRRVGKTSLVKYLMYEYLPSHGAVQPVFVDLQGLNEYHSEAVASLIVTKVYQAVKKSLPPRESSEPIWSWVEGALREVVQLHSRLLIIIDEFNFLIDAERTGKLDPIVYDNLRFLMNALREVKWLLVVQDTHFLNRERWLSAGVLFQTNHTLTVPHLNRDWASRLILEPAKKCGVTLENEGRLLNRIFRLTAGNPFLIHLVCRELVDRAKRRDDPTTVDDGVLSAASAVVLHVGQRHFNHFTRSLTGSTELVMAAVTSFLQRKKSVPESEVFQLLAEKVPELRTEVIERNLKLLEVEGQIGFKSWLSGTSRRITIPIELYRQFITRDLIVEDSIEKWRAARAGTVSSS